MKRIRIGKDISLRWEITTDGMAIPLEGRDLMVEIKSPMSVVSNIPFRVDGNTIIMTYYGTEQKSVGEHSITLWENKGKPGQNVVDAVKAFKLVKTSPEEDDFANGDIQVETIDLGTANLDVMIGPATPGESPDLSALKEQVNANTASISKINEELVNIQEEQTEQNNSIAHINTTIEEHSERIAQLESSTPGGDSEAIAQINSTLQGIKTEQAEQNSTLADHEERLVYTEGDLVKVREEYNGIISELVKSIAHTQKAFVVETNDSEGYIYIDNVKKIIPANSIKAFRFNNVFRSANDPNTGIASFRFLITDTSEITNMSWMFAKCSSITPIDVTNFDTHSVTDMSYMFHLCSSLTSIDVTNFDTSAVKGMDYMFFGCSSLISLDVNNFDTSAVTSMFNMFGSCSSLASLDLTNFDTHAVTSMRNMFNGCSSLTSLDLSNFDTHAVTNMDGMFGSCSSLASLDLTAFDTSKVSNMIEMFRGCSSLTSLDLSSFDTSKVSNMIEMFRGCSSLTSLLLGPNFFKTSAVTSIDFSTCSKWTNETVVTSLVTNSYDRAAAGLNTLTIKLHKNTKAALTDEQKATITSKGYTIA